MAVLSQDKIEQMVGDILRGRAYSPEERVLISAVLVVSGQRFLRLARQCRNACLIAQSEAFLEAAQAVAELRFDLVGGDSVPDTALINANRKSREVLIRAMGATE